MVIASSVPPIEGTTGKRDTNTSQNNQDRSDKNEVPPKVKFNLIRPIDTVRHTIPVKGGIDTESIVASLVFCVCACSAADWITLDNVYVCGDADIQGSWTSDESFTSPTWTITLIIRKAVTTIIF